MPIKTKEDNKNKRFHCLPSRYNRKHYDYIISKMNKRSVVYSKKQLCNGLTKKHLLKIIETLVKTLVKSLFFFIRKHRH